MQHIKFHRDIITNVTRFIKIAVLISTIISAPQTASFPLQLPITFEYLGDR